MDDCQTLGNVSETILFGIKFSADKKRPSKHRVTWEDIRLQYYLECHILFNSIPIAEIFVPGIFPDIWKILGLFTCTGMLCMLFFWVDICRQV